MSDEDLKKKRLARVETLKARRKEIEEDPEISYKEAKPQLDDIDDIISLLTGETKAQGEVPPKPKKKSWI